MYTSFNIKNFRCLKDLTIEPLARVNLIAGKNNTGKTTLLEALRLHTGPNQPDFGFRLSIFRGIPSEDPGRLLHDLFYDFDPEHPITLSATGNGKVGHGTLNITSRPRDRTVVTTVPATNGPAAPRGSQEADVSAISNTEIVLDYTDETGQTYTSSGRWVRSEGPSVPIGRNVLMMADEGFELQSARMPTRPHSVFLGARQRTGADEDVKRFGEAELAGYADRIADCLKMVDARIKRLMTIAAPPMPMVYADVGLRRPVPIGFLGDGVSRFLSMALAFHQARNGVILIDEVENGLHYSVLQDVWKNLDWLSREFNVQVFATTQNNECMVAARDAFKGTEDTSLYIHRLDLQDKQIEATTYPFDALDFTLDYGAEIR